MKFKVGDKVKINKFLRNNCVACIDPKADYIRITKVDKDHNAYEFISCDASGDSLSSCDGHTALIHGCTLLDDTKKEKPQPVQFVAIWDERSGDPAKTFTSKKELDEWLKEAYESERIIKSSIRVFSVKEEHQVKVNFSLKKV